MYSKMERLSLKSKPVKEGSKAIKTLKIEGILLIPPASLQLYFHTWLSLFFSWVSSYFCPVCFCSNTTELRRAHLQMVCS